MKTPQLAVSALLVACAATSCGLARYKCRARQSEAKATLGQIKAAETSYFGEHKTYTASTEDLHLPIAARYYSIELSITGGGKGYEAVAKGDKPDTTGDEWSVTESTAVTAKHDKCED